MPAIRTSAKPTKVAAKVTAHKGKVQHAAAELANKENNPRDGEGAKTASARKAVTKQTLEARNKALEDEVAKMKGERYLFTLPSLFSTAACFVVHHVCDVELLARSRSTQINRGKPKKKVESKISKPAGSAGDNYSIIEEMGLKDKKSEFKSIQVSEEQNASLQV